MNRICVCNSETGLIDIDVHLATFIYEMEKNGTVEIFLNNEGPCAKHIGVYDKLDKICHQFGFTKSTVNVITRNLLERHDSYNVVINPPFTFVKMCKDYATINIIPSKNFKTIKHFGMFIGRSNWKRLWLASTLFNLGNSAITYHYDHSHDSHKSNLGLDELMHELGSVSFTMPLLNATPLTRDEINGYPIDGRKATQPSLNAANFAGEYFAEIVCETYTLGTTFFPTEKTWRPIMCKTPFILQGPSEFLTNLKVLGFKTFDKWWDESYDYQVGKTKIETIIQVINMLSKKTAKELETMYNEMLPILDHNYNLLMSLSYDQLLNAQYVKE